MLLYLLPVLISGWRPVFIICLHGEVPQNLSTIFWDLNHILSTYSRRLLCHAIPCISHSIIGYCAVLEVFLPNILYFESCLIWWIPSSMDVLHSMDLFLCCYIIQRSFNPIFSNFLVQFLIGLLNVSHLSYLLMVHSHWKVLLCHGAFPYILCLMIIQMFILWCHLTEFLYASDFVQILSLFM